MKIDYSFVTAAICVAITAYMYHIINVMADETKMLVAYNQTLKLDWQAERRNLYEMIALMPEDKLQEFYQNNRNDLEHNNNKYTNFLLQTHPELDKQAPK